jgi:hypothetical protein
MYDILPVLNIFGRLTLDFWESQCLLQGPESLTETKQQIQKFLVI